MSKVFVTATSWDDDRSMTLKGVLESAREKHGADVTLVTGYSAVAIKIAAIASIFGFSVQMIAPDLKVVGEEHVNTANNITVFSTTPSGYASAIADLGIDGVIAFDKGDPFVLKAISAGIKVWFPT